MRQPLERLQGDQAAAKSFDNRMAVWICAETLRLLRGKSFSAGVYSVSTVQEEIGLRPDSPPRRLFKIPACRETDE